MRQLEDRLSRRQAPPLRYERIVPVVTVVMVGLAIVFILDAALASI
jgi:hypothetical protein